jgi:prevent-host-death family protein
VQIPISAAKARLSELAEIASGGQEIVLTVHGEPKARLVPLIPSDDPTWEEIVRPANEAREKIRPEDLRPNPLIEARRRRNNLLRGLR